MDKKGKLSDKIILIIVLIIVSAFARTAVHTIMTHILPPDKPSQSNSQQLSPMQQYQLEQAEKEYAAQIEAQREAYQAANGQ